MKKSIVKNSLFGKTSTNINIRVSNQENDLLKILCISRGFNTVSDYIRFLFRVDCLLSGFLEDYYFFDDKILNLIKKEYKKNRSKL